jgi:esterase/lipase superfamily enzyme
LIERVAAWPGPVVRSLVVMSLCFALAACAVRPESGYLTPVAGAPLAASDYNILIATTRKKDPRPGTMYGDERSAALSFASIDVSVPPNHVSGHVELAALAPGNPENDFVVRQEQYLDDDKQFITNLNNRLAASPPGQRRVLLFVHGYNTMFAEGLYRFAQIVHDSKSPAVPVLFSWASRGKLNAYVYDTNSATAARDDLEHTLRLILASNADGVDILAHSMGNWVTLEAFRQIKISGNKPQMSKLGAVVLAAPDVDVDVFKSQMRRLGKPPRPYYILVSRDDKALSFSSFIAGDEPRLGADSNISELNALGATVIDVTDVRGKDPSNHQKFAELAAIAPKLRPLLEQGILPNARQVSDLGVPVHISAGQ